MLRQPGARQGTNLRGAFGHEEAHACRVRMRSATGFRVWVGECFKLGGVQFTSGVPGLR